MRGDRVWEGTAASGGRRKGRTRGEASRATIRVWNYFAILISDVGDFGLRPGQRASRPGGKLRAPPRLLTLICAHAHETHGASATPTTLSAFPRFIDAALRCSPPLLVLRFRLTILRECPALSSRTARDFGLFRGLSGAPPHTTTTAARTRQHMHLTTQTNSS